MSDIKPIEITVSVRNNRMKQARLKRGYSQKMLADIAGVSIAWVTALETLRPIEGSDSWKTLEHEQRMFFRKQKIADALETPVDEMFPEELNTIKRNRVVKNVDIPTRTAIHANTERLRIGNSERALFEHSINEETVAAIRDILEKNLSEREFQIVERRFGIGGERPLTLEEVGKQFKATRERIRQIETKAFRKLRRPYNRKRFEKIGVVPVRRD